MAQRLLFNWLLLYCNIIYLFIDHHFSAEVVFSDPVDTGTYEDSTVDHQTTDWNYAEPRPFRVGNTLIYSRINYFFLLFIFRFYVILLSTNLNFIFIFSKFTGVYYCKLRINLFLFYSIL